MKTINVNASKNYDVLIGKGLLDEAGSIIRGIAGGEAAAIVSDHNVERLYVDRLKESLLQNRYRVESYIFPPGESSKSGANLLFILNSLADSNFSRSDVVISLGGGVPGDLGGFAAAAYMRGIRFVQMPTTLLAAVDSSVGGKTAVNLNAGKNLAGAFFQPDAVLCDVETLSTLSPEDFSTGCAEVIKHGVIAGRDLFDSYSTPIENNLEEIIARNIEVKRDIVIKDEFERDQRKLLNFGHTLGHAIEHLSAYKCSHGQAVAAGMAVITRAAVRMGLGNEKCLFDLLKILKQYRLPLNTEFKAAELARTCLSDKKRSGKSITLIIPRDIGDCVLKEIPVGDLESVIRLGLEEL